MQLSAISLAITRLWSGSSAWSPASLWPTGTEPGMWIDPSNLDASWADSTGTTPVSTPGTVADSSNPVGLALDLRLGATVLTDPGNHLLQATSTARPLESARVNLLTYTEDFTSGAWRNFNSGMIITTEQTDPDGGTTAVLLKPTAELNWHGFDKLNYFSDLGNNTFRVCIKPDGLRYFFGLTGSAQVSDIGTLGACFDLTGAGSVVRVGSWNASATVELDASGYYICTINSTNSSGGIAFGASNSATFGEFTGDGVSGFYFSFPDLRSTGSAATLPPYQSVPGNGSSYPSTGFPIFQKFDGTDDGMATATFTAGTLSSAMDCMIAVRRDSAVLPSVCGLYQVDQTKFFGVVAEEPTNGAGTFQNCGSPSIFVDGVSVANTRGALHSAIGVGDWHILEYRDLDLSAWVNAGYGSYGSGYMVNGAQGGILLFPSSTSADDRDAARTWLGAKVGLTL